MDEDTILDDVALEDRIRHLRGWIETLEEDLVRERRELERLEEIQWQRKAVIRKQLEKWTRAANEHNETFGTGKRP